LEQFPGIQPSLWQKTQPHFLSLYSSVPRAAEAGEAEDFFGRKELEDFQEEAMEGRSHYIGIEPGMEF